MISAEVKIYSYIQNIIMRVITIVAILALALAVNGQASVQHLMNGAASTCVYDGIKYELYFLPYAV
jgi:glycerol-3-phosphate O-acyltransferase